MKDNRLNDAAVLEQVDGQYEKFLLLVLRKYLPAGVVLTLADIAAVVTEQQDPWVLFAHGHKESIEFKAIRMSEARRIVEHDEATNRGRG
jgi:hypothetical protein